MEETPRVAAVLPAGGTGERLGGCTPKQYCPLLGRPLISCTLEAFERVGWIADIVVVVAPESVSLMKDIIHKYGHQRVTLVEGAETRHRSILNGLRVFVEDHSLGPAVQKPEVVIIHDAVRPFVEEDTLLQVTRSARQHGAAGAVRPLVSTVIASSSDGCLDHSLERAKHRASEMPQAFLFDVIYKAYLQVTYKRDLYAAESIIKERISQHLCIITNMKEEAVQIGFLLHENLKPHIKHVKALSSSMCRTLHDVQSIFQGQCYNYVCINVKDSDVEESRKLIDLLQTANVGTYPSVVVSVHLDVAEQCSSSGTPRVTGIRELAREARKHNILLYGLLINFCKDESQLQASGQEASAIICAVTKDRNPALAGQLMVA
ncbi:D-ribitol-5-phosphate cytidylyltransferase isoform X2 [Pseudophryne corroboree]|uniref:D-ribitol-5-phosphate cytidylyltransferase isoform X2 n=1 Tax=Pseudophryne corroboree TaxID=495146 RepID=UPI003081A3B7